MATPKKPAAEKKGRGGARPGSGPKPRALVVAKAEVLRAVAGDGPATIEDKAKAAEYAFRLFDETQRDPGLELEVRLDCAREILDRAWGRPSQALQVAGPGGGAVPIAFDLTGLTDADLALLARITPRLAPA